MYGLVVVLGSDLLAGHPVWIGGNITCSEHILLTRSEEGIRLDALVIGVYSQLTHKTSNWSDPSCPYQDISVNLMLVGEDQFSHLGSVL